MASSYYDSHYSYRAPKHDHDTDYSRENPSSHRYTSRHLGHRTDAHRSRSRVNSPARSPTRGRHYRSRRWPPPPSVEDERASLAREYPPPSSRSLRSSDDDVPSRGSIEQDPLLIEVETLDRRFVVVPEQPRDPHRRQKEDGHTSKNRDKLQNPTLLDPGFEEPWVLPQRQPSPYSFTRTPEKPVTNETHLSPQTARASKSTVPTQSTAGVDHVRSHAMTREGSLEGYTSRGSKGTEDSEGEMMSAFKANAEKSNRRVSFGRETSRERRPYYRNQDYPGDSTNAPQLSTSGANRTKTSAQPERVERTDYDERHRAPAPETMKPPNIPRAESGYTGNPSKYEQRRDTTAYSSPPRSPRRNRYPDSPHDSPSSTPSSRSSSRASSPVPRSSTGPSVPTYPSASHDGLNNQRSSTYPYTPKEKPIRPTPLSTSTRQDSVDKILRTRSPAGMTPPINPLPYPDDDVAMLMPHEGHYQFNAPEVEANKDSRRRSNNHASYPGGPTQSPVADAYSAHPTTEAAYRPKFPLRSFNSDVGPQTTTDASKSRMGNPIHSRDQAPSSPSIGRRSRASSTSALAIKLPPCPRREWTRKYDDWYTMADSNDFDVCPDCLDDIIRPSQFRRHFTRAPSRSASVRTRCDFGSPWIRLAWLLTLHRQRTDLDLIYGLSAIISADTPCPGNTEGPGPWYGLQDEMGQLIPNFAICACDRKQIETLFPSLINVFPRLPPSPSHSGQHRLCSFRAMSNRFPQYLDALVSIDETARQTQQRPPNLRPLTDLVRSHLHKQECRRDAVLTDATWHFIPKFPECTVCEECFDDVIWPHVKRGNSSLADAFNRTLHPLPHSAILEKGMPLHSASCQLYSKRMRRVFERAVKYEDFGYLARKIKQRREVEGDTFARRTELERLLANGRGVVEGKEVFVGSQKDVEAIRWQLEAIEKEWKEWE